ncbi:MAG: hypothetical protein IIV91_01940 [Alistipes sp.]|jgi:hypothetical protein|nr:hypothetical protein [Alistipes sp.]
MKHIFYSAPSLRNIELQLERGFGTSLEIPKVDPEQGWAYNPNYDDIVVE